MRPYVYGGKIHDLDEPVAPDLCATMAGYRLHRRNGEEICPECREAKRRQASIERANHRPNPDAFTTESCGTNAGYRRHHYYSTPACDACKAAFAEYHRNRRARQKLAA